MHLAIASLATDAGWRLKALMKCRRFHSRNALVKLFKIQVLSYIESATPAIANAAPTLLDRIDRAARRFLRDILSQADVLQHYSLAPLETRREIAVLGMIHKCTFGRGHCKLAAYVLFDFVSSNFVCICFSATS